MIAQKVLNDIIMALEPAESLKSSDSLGYMDLMRKIEGEARERRFRIAKRGQA